MMPDPTADESPAGPGRRIPGGPRPAPVPLAALHAIACRLQEGLQQDRLAQEAIRVLEEQLGYRYGAVLLIDESGERLVPFALSAQGGGAEFIERDKSYVASRDVRVGKGITGWVAEHGESVLLDEVASDPRYFAIRPDIRSELCVPMKVGEKVIGVVNTESPAAGAYGDEDRQLLEIVATQIGFAIAMQRLNGIDALTGAANRREFDERLPRELRRRARENAPLSLLLMDIDCFKEFNDGYGHQEGDRFLREFVSIVSRELRRAGDLVARYGGEEFAVILPATGEGDARRLAELIRLRVVEAAIPHAHSPVAAHLTVSIGVASATSRNDTSFDLVARADDALYRAKRAGRNRVA